MTNNTIVFFSNTITPRLRYVAELVFENLLNLNLVFIQDKKVLVESLLPKINYSETPLCNGEYFIKNQTLLFENTISKDKIDSNYSFFTQQLPFDFDVLAAIFLLVTRYEEYVVDEVSLDTHNRFSAKMSVAYKGQFLNKPVVNQWVMKIKQYLETLFPELQITSPTYQFQPSFDIDMPWKYKHKGFFRIAGGFAKDLVTGHFEELTNRL
jgi:hypothetical protein